MFKKSLAMAMLVALTACSSGGNSASHSGEMADNAKQTNKQTNKQIDHNSSQSSSSSQSDPKAMYGGVHWFSQEGQNGYFTPASDLESLTLDGKKFSLLLGKEIKKAQLGNLSFGVHLAKSSDNDYAFVTGKLTAESQMPQAGEFTYKGKAFYGSEELQGWFDGTSSFTVDFANKTVKGQIQANNRTISLLKADIKGNKFEARQGRERINGNFFGKNASELGGTWGREMNGKGETAVFGATKQ